MININWLEGLGNLPQIIIEDDLDMMPREDCEYTFVDGMWYHIQKNGIVRYFSHNGKDVNQGGFGGASFTFLHKGQPKTLMGPWSGRASYLNMFLKPEYQVADVTVYNGRNSISCGILVSKLITLWDQDAYLLRSTDKNKPEQGAITASLAPNCILKPDNSRYDPAYDYQVFAEPVRG